MAGWRDRCHGLTGRMAAAAAAAVAAGGGLLRWRGRIRAVRGCLDHLIEMEEEHTGDKHVTLSVMRLHTTTRVT